MRKATKRHFMKDHVQNEYTGFGGEFQRKGWDQLGEKRTLGPENRNGKSKHGKGHRWSCEKQEEGVKGLGGGCTQGHNRSNNALNGGMLKKVWTAVVNGWQKGLDIRRRTGGRPILERKPRAWRGKVSRTSSVPPRSHKGGG